MPEFRVICDQMILIFKYARYERQKKLISCYISQNIFLRFLMALFRLLDMPFYYFSA
jgi:hypothetical protein